MQHSQGKTSADRPPQRSKKAKDSKPKVSTLPGAASYEIPAAFMDPVAFNDYAAAELSPPHRDYFQNCDFSEGTEAYRQASTSGLVADFFELEGRSFSSQISV